MKFEASEVTTFAGGTFDLGRPRTVGELRGALAEMDKELAGWGDETVISEVHVHNGNIDVTLRDGIPQ